MKLVCFNINGIRAREHQLNEIVRAHDPDIIGLQETKVVDDDFPVEMFSRHGYHVEYFGQKGHYGVALASRQPPLSVRRGLPGDPEDAQRRLITCTWALAGGRQLTVVNGYFPQGESRDHPVKFPGKQAFFAGVADYIESSFDPSEPVVLMGDLNVAPRDLDIGIGDDNRQRWLKQGKTSFLPEEREWFERFTSWGFEDLWRALNTTEDDRFSWFDYRSRGFERSPRRGLRIDHILGTDFIADRLVEADIDYDTRAMEKPSDHCPVWVEIERLVLKSR